MQEVYYRMAANKEHKKSMEKLIDTHLKIFKFNKKNIEYTPDVIALTETLALCEKYEDSDLRDKIINFYDKIGKIYPKARKRYEEITTGISTKKQKVETTETTPNIQKPKQIPNEVFKKPDPFINKQKEEESKNEYSEIKKLADKGDGDAIKAYFNLIYNEEVSVNEEEKLKYYKMAADMGIIDTNDKFICDYANILYDNDEYEKAFEYFKKAVDKGNEYAVKECFKLIRDNEVDVSDKEKIKYYKMAMDIGEHHAANEYLKLILDNKVDISEKKRLKYIKTIAEEGNVQAAYEYGRILYNGLYGATINKKEANDFLKFAADIDIADTDGKFAYNYANILYKDNKIEEALKYFKKAADRGNEKALEECNCTPDEKRVIECFKITQKGVEEVKYLADKGNTEAMYELSNYYSLIEKVKHKEKEVKQEEEIEAKRKERETKTKQEEEKVKQEEEEAKREKEEAKREEEEAKQKKEKYYKMAADKGYEKAIIKFKDDPLSKKINRFEKIRDNLVKYNYNIIQESSPYLFKKYENFVFRNNLHKLDFILHKNRNLERLIDEEAKRICGEYEYNKIYSKATDRMSGNKTFKSNKMFHKELIKVECFKNLVNRIFDEITENIESYNGLNEETIISKAIKKIENELVEENKREKTDEEKIELLEERNKFLTVVLKKKGLDKKMVYDNTTAVLNEEQLEKIKKLEDRQFREERRKVEKELKEKSVTNLMENMYKNNEDATMLAIIANEKEIERLKEKLKNKNKPVAERLGELKREARGTKQEYMTNEAARKKTESRFLEESLIKLDDKTQEKEGVGQSNSYPG